MFDPNDTQAPDQNQNQQAPNSGLTYAMKPETADYLDDLSGIGLHAYLAMRDPDPPEYDDWLDKYFAADGSGNYVSREGQTYSDDDLEQMHGLLGRQAGNPLISNMFIGPKFKTADYLVWRNQNFSDDGGPWQDDDDKIYSEPAMQEMFEAKFVPQPASTTGTNAGVSTPAGPAAKVQKNPQPFALPTTDNVEEFFGGTPQFNAGKTSDSSAWDNTLGAPLQQDFQVPDTNDAEQFFGGSPKFYPNGEPSGTADQNSNTPNLDFTRQKPPAFLPALPQLQVPSRIPPQSSVTPPQLNDEVGQRRTMSRLFRDLRPASVTPMGVAPNGAPMLDLTSQLKAPSRIPWQFDKGKNFSNINIGYIKKDEGGTRLTANVPQTGTDRSGVTIAAGFDIGQHSLAELRRFGFSNDLTDKLSPYVGLTGEDARDALAKTPLTVTAPEAAEINRTVLNSKLNAAATAFDDARATPGAFAKLPWQAQTIIGDPWYNIGDLRNKQHGAPEFWKQATTGDWEGAYQNLMDFSHKDKRLFDRAQQNGRLLRGAIDSDAFPNY